MSCSRLILTLTLSWLFGSLYAQSNSEARIRYIKPGEKVRLVGAPASAYQWFLNGKPIAGASSLELIASEEGMYTLQVYNEQGCPSEMSEPVIISITRPSEYLTIPNIITPNGDGKNDYFVIKGLERYPENELIILNRWGSHVFEQRRYNHRWNGDGLSEGTYFYLLKIRDESGQLQVFRGYLTLMRPK